jgi:predicted metal-binding protein
MDIQTIQVVPQIDLSVRGLCTKVYPGHPKGCPNFNHKDGCPPGAPQFDDVYDLSEPIYAIVNKFDISEHRKRMRNLHPTWSLRQLDCCLYWQPKARKQLMIGIKQFLGKHSKYHFTTCPEAMGVDITKTLELVGIHLEWPPVNFTYQVTLAGLERKCSSCGCTWYNGCRNGCYWVAEDKCSNCS